MLPVRFASLLFMVLGSAQSWYYFAQELFCTYEIVARVEMVSMEKAQLNPDLQEGLDNTPRWMENLPIKVLEVYRDKTPGNVNLKKYKGTMHVAYTKQDKQLDAFDYGDYSSIVGQQYLVYFDDWDKIILGDSVTRWCSKVDKACSEARHVTSFHKHFLDEGGFDCSCRLDDCYDRCSGTVGVPRCIGDRWEEGNVACSRDLKTKECVWKGSKKTCVNPNWVGCRTISRRKMF